MPTAPGKLRDQVDLGGVLPGPNPPAAPARFQIQVTIHLKHQQFPLLALLHTGAAENFIDQDLALAHRLGVPLSPIYPFIPVTSVDAPYNPNRSDTKPSSFTCPLAAIMNRFDYWLFLPLVFLS